MQLVPGALFPGLTRLGHVAKQSPPSSAEIRNSGAMPPLSHTPLLRSTELSTGTTSSDLIFHLLERHRQLLDDNLNEFADRKIKLN